MRFPPATLLLLIVAGTEAQAEAIKKQTGEFMAEQMRLTLSPEKTAMTHVDDGFDFLGLARQTLAQARSGARRDHVPERPRARRHQAPHQGANRARPRRTCRSMS